MKLREFKTKQYHYFVDEQNRRQGEFRGWDVNGQQRLVCHFRGGKFHGEYREWNWPGELYRHRFFIDGNEIIDFLKNPELYPETPEEKTMFVLKYGSAPFIREGEDE